MASPAASPATSPDPAGGARVDVAARRLDQALARLRQRLSVRLAEANADVGGLFDRDRAQLAADLDAAKARNRELEEAAAQALQAVDQAVAQMRQARATSRPEAEA